MSVWLIVILLAFLSGITTIIGVGVALCIKNNPKAIAVGIGFSAGIMLLISFFELLPESINCAGLNRALIAFASGIVIIAILNYLIPHIHLFDENCQAKDKKNLLLKTAYLCAIGLILHDFPEGFAMANSYIISPNLGILLAAAIALHNIPEEFAISVPIIAAGREKSFLYKAAFVSALAEPAGAVIGLSAASIIPSLTSVFLSFAGGAMVFISLHELFPLAKRYNKTLMFICGLVLSLIVYIALATFIPE